MILYIFLISFTFKHKFWNKLYLRNIPGKKSSAHLGVLVNFIAEVNAFVLFSTGMRITAFDFGVPVNMVCAIMSCWETDIESFSAVINHVQATLFISKSRGPDKILRVISSLR